MAADPAAAVKWYRLAAQQGQNNAQLNLGQAYFSGLGVAQNQAEAIKWYRQAAAQGNAKAQYNLGIAHYHGQSVPVDPGQAFAWYLKAAQHHHPGAINNLGAMVNETPTLKRHRVIAYGLFSLSAELDPSDSNLAKKNKAQLGASLSPQELAAGQAFARELAQSDDLSTVLLAQLGGAPFSAKVRRR